MGMGKKSACCVCEKITKPKASGVIEYVCECVSKC